MRDSRLSTTVGLALLVVGVVAARAHGNQSSGNLRVRKLSGDTAGSGERNKATGDYATVSGSSSNRTVGHYSPVGGGWSNEAAPLLPGVVHGQNTSVGTADERRAAEAYFGAQIMDDQQVWLNNSMTRFIGKTLRMTGLEIIKRNGFNTAIEACFKLGTVLWKIEPGPQGVCGDWVEHIDGVYTGVMHTAGFVSPGSWIENDHRILHGHAVANDWGFVETAASTETGFVLKYWSYKKGRFNMTWAVHEAEEEEGGTRAEDGRARIATVPQTLY